MQIAEQVIYYSPEELTAHPLNDVYHSPLDEGEYAALYASIEELGIQEPLWITPNKTIISGHERWKIAQKLNRTRIPTRTIESATEQDLIYLLVTANEARRGTETDFIKKAKKLKIRVSHIIKQRNTNSRQNILSMSHNDTISEDSDYKRVFGMSKSSVYKLLKLLDLIPELQEYVSKGAVGLTAGNELASLPINEQRRIYEYIKKYNIKEVKTAEIQAIRKELEYIRERDPNRERKEPVQQIQEDEIMEIEFVSSDFEEEDYEVDREEEKETNPLDDHPSEQKVEDKSQPREKVSVEDRPWHSTLEAPKQTIDAVAPIFEDDANAVNVRKRLFMDQVKKAEKQIDSVCRNLAPFFDLIIDHPDAIMREEMNSLLQKIEDMNSQLEEVVAWRERTYRK